MAEPDSPPLLIATSTEFVGRLESAMMEIMADLAVSLTEPELFLYPDDS